MNINFKIATKESISEILNMMNDFYSIDGYEFNYKIAKENLIRFIKNKDLGFLWLIELDSETVGYVVLTYGFSFEYKGKDAFIDELYLKEYYRNQGIGKVTLNFLKHQAIISEINAIHLEVEKHNEKGNELYKNNGYKVSNRILMTQVIN